MKTPSGFKASLICTSTPVGLVNSLQSKSQKLLTWQIVDPMKAKTRYDCFLGVSRDRIKQLLFIYNKPLNRNCSHIVSQVHEMQGRLRGAPSNSSDGSLSRVRSERILNEKIGDYMSSLTTQV
jgi:hypothetical protein